MASIDWVQGFFDRSTHISQDYPAIVATTASRHLAYKAAGALKQLGFKCTVRQYKQRYTIRISGLEELERWHQEIRFSDPRQQKYLSEVIRVARSSPVRGSAPTAKAPSP